MNMKNLTERQNIVISYTTTSTTPVTFSRTIYMEHEQNVVYPAMASVT